MSRNRLGSCAYLIVLLVAGYSAAYAQDTYPTKPIRILTSPAGGGGDFASRIIADGLTSSLREKVIVDNRPAILASEVVANAPADGYTVLVVQSQFWTLPLLQDNVPYDPVKQFAPISITDKSPVILVVHPSLPVKSVPELIKFAKSRPGELNFSRPSVGSPTHLAAELFKSMAGIDIVGIAYKGGAGAAMAIMSGEVHMGFVSLAAGREMIKAKRLRGLAVSTVEPSPMFPELPTVAAAGLQGFDAALIGGMFAPAGTPASIINKLSQEVVQVLRRPGPIERFSKAGVTAVGSSPEALASLVKSDMVKYGKLARDAKIRIK